MYYGAKIKEKFMKKLLLVMLCVMPALLHSADQKNINPNDIGNASQLVLKTPDGVNTIFYKKADDANYPEQALYKTNDKIFLVNLTDQDFNLRIEIENKGYASDESNDVDTCTTKNKFQVVNTSTNYEDDRYEKLVIYKPGPSGCGDNPQDNKIGTMDFKDKRLWESLTIVFEKTKPNQGVNSKLKVTIYKTKDTSKVFKQQEFSL